MQALAKVNRTDVALRMLLATEYPSYGYNIVVNEEHATSLWESWDGSSMQQWFDESSRDHHFSASINTFLRKYGPLHNRSVAHPFLLAAFHSKSIGEQ